MRVTKLRIFTALLGLNWASACTDSIGTPNVSEADEIEATEDAGGGTEPERDGGPDAGPVACETGFALVDGMCMDVDECEVDNGGCGDVARATCTNNAGAPPTCKDVNECEVNNGGCGDSTYYRCTNRDRVAPECLDLAACGTENGGCGNPAFNTCSYDQNGRVVCGDVNECLVENGGCGDPMAMRCMNQVNGKNTCSDVDECSDASLNNCPVDQPCVNIKGSYFCGCEYPTIFDGTLGDCRPARVLVLDDGGSTSLLADLQTEGFAATDGGLYYGWDQTPDLSNFDTVLWLEGFNYGNALLSGIDQALVDFVKSGGGLIRTEWGIWYTAKRRLTGIALNPLTADIMPVAVPASDDYGNAAVSWTVTDTASPLARGLPLTFSTTGGFTLLDLRPGSQLVATTTDSRRATPIPVLSYTAIHGGITVHVNDTLLYPNGVRTAIEPEIKQVYFNAVHFSAQRPAN